MKTLLLSSGGDFAIDHGLPLLGIPEGKIRLAYITTASKGEKDQGYISYYTRKMDGLGIDYEEIDIEGKRVRDLKSFLAEKNVIYVEGGNTFYLMKAVRESGFDAVVKGLVGKGIPYVGVSAGSYIACPTIEMATWKPNPDRNRYGLTDLSGLNLAPFMLSVHYRDEYKDILKENISKCKYPVRILTDEQAILIRGGKAELVGNKKEITL
ncbi:MAG: Type 1 glutamine amidotransferase-like domain-containing protein [Candidatus Aenigmarchaeota archaeon]|nr:Type 1 glutamine amidotransferase-like domain-containing protein [Candidatus Aenigmarchaeota archaeon]